MIVCAASASEAFKHCVESFPCGWKGHRRYTHPRPARYWADMLWHLPLAARIAYTAAAASLRPTAANHVSP